MGTVRNMFDWEPVSKGVFIDDEWIWDKLPNEVDPVQRAKWAVDHYKNMPEETIQHDVPIALPIAAVLFLFTLCLFVITFAR